ncbi:MAG: hypothetical protein FJ194_18730 [Gammaproteobacteria bacterium]|nr:hypothetical protein [Gammaproteobacteria bacterium]
MLAGFQIIDRFGGVDVGLARDRLGKERLSHPDERTLSLIMPGKSIGLCQRFHVFKWPDPQRWKWQVLKPAFNVHGLPCMVVVTDVEQLIVAIEVTAQRDDGGCIVPQEQSGAERREFGHPAA